MKDEWWLHAAITDDNLVADLLLRLKDSAPSASTSFLLKPLPPSWGTRQPRSKPSSTSSVLSLSAPEKRRETRRSPTTPLSWTGGGASPSEGGCEESSSLNLQLHHNHNHSHPSDRSRSKISAASDTPTTNTTSKRPRKKKTFAELKEEESSLLKERIFLKKELATLRTTLKDQRSINENLKRIKLDFQAESGIKSEAKSDPDARNTNGNGASEAASSSASRRVKNEDASGNSFPAEGGATSQDPVFVLPDLNMSPDEECGVVGMS